MFSTVFSAAVGVAAVVAVVSAHRLRKPHPRRRCRRHLRLSPPLDYQLRAERPAEMHRRILAAVWLPQAARLALPGRKVFSA